MFDVVRDYLADPGAAEPLARVISGAVLVLLSALSYFAASVLISRLIRRMVARTRSAFADLLLNERLLKALSRMVPVLIFYHGTRVVFSGMGDLLAVAQSLSMVVLILLTLFLLHHLVRAADRIYNRYPVARSRPIKGYLQLLTVFLYIIGLVLIISMLLDRPAWGFISGIGALSAVLLLVFKDSLLGLVASFQISANDMVEIGDWIEMPKYNADGDVIDISLQTIKVRNWDKTITSIPIYALVSDSFKNWRGMTESGGRRIMRSIHIDMKSIRLCDAAMLERFRKIHYIKDYIAAKEEELARYNAERGIDDSVKVNGRRLTNIGTFRAYMTSYLRHHPGLRQDMTLMVRQLDPGPKGVPLQVWTFTATTAWVDYEGIQSDIFDHLLSVLSEFDLRAFQEPSGWDMERIGMGCGGPGSA